MLRACRQGRTLRARLSGPLCSRDAELTALVSLSVLLIAEACRQGAMLIHGALIERAGLGVLLAAASGVGKTTATRRLPPPWRAWSDDATLLVRDRGGRYWAHPWPTWSRLFDGDENATWPVEQAVPLAGIFFLQRSAPRSWTRLCASRAAVDILNRLYESSWDLVKASPGVRARLLLRRFFFSSCDLAETVPCWTLRVTLHNRFWEAMDGALADTATRRERP